MLKKAKFAALYQQEIYEFKAPLETLQLGCGVETKLNNFVGELIYNIIHQTGSLSDFFLNTRANINKIVNLFDIWKGLY